jgi:hypothetical protein
MARVAGPRRDRLTGASEKPAREWFGRARLDRADSRPDVTTGLAPDTEEIGRAPRPSGLFSMACGGRTDGFDF